MREADLNTIYDHLPVAICVVNRERHILYANPELSALTGIPPDQLEGGHACGAFGCIHALDDPRGCGFGEHCAECSVRLACEETFLRGDEHRTVERRFTLERDGVRRTVIVLASTTRIRLDNRDALLLCLQDITERSDLEMRYAALAENTAIGIYRTTPAGEIVSANPTLVRMLGYDSFEDLAKRNLSREGFETGYPREQFIERIEREGRITALESSWTLADGSRKWFLENAVLTRDGEGRPLYYDGTVEDVTRLKENEIRYRRLYEDQRLTGEIASTLAAITVENAEARLDRVLETIGEYLGVDRVRIVPPGNGDEPESRERVWCASGVPPRSADDPSRVPEERARLTTPFDQGDPLVIQDVAILPPDTNLQGHGYLPRDARSLVYLPFPKTGKDSAGFLGCEVVHGSREWTTRDVDILRVIAGMLATSVAGLTAFRELRKNEARLRTVLDSVTDVVWSLSFPDFVPLFISPSAEALYGLPVDVFYTDPMKWQELVHPDDRHTTETAFADLQTHGFAERECRIVRPDGEERWILDRSRIVYDETGNPVAITGVAGDVTRRKTAQLELERATWALGERIKERDALASVWNVQNTEETLEKRLSKAVNTIPPGFQYPDVTCARIVFEETQYVSADFSETPWVLSEEISVAGETVGLVSVYYTEELPTEDNGPFLNEEMTLLREIAIRIGMMVEHARMFETLRVQAAAMESAGSSIIICSALKLDTPIVYANDAFEGMTGYRKAEAVGRNPRFLHHHDSEQPGPEEIRAAIREGRECAALLRNVRKDGTPFWCEMRINPVYNGAGIITHYVGVSSDVTDVLNMRRKLLKNEKRLRLLLQNVPNMAVQGYKLGGETVFWNSASEKVYGYTKSEALGRNLLDLIIPPEMRAIVLQAMKQMVETGVAIPARELSLMRKDGSRVSVFSGHVIISASDDEPVLYCIDYDLTEQKEREAEVLAGRELQRVLADVAAVLVAMDHESIEVTMDAVLERIGTRFAADRSAVFLFSADGSTIRTVYEWFRTGLQPGSPVLQGIPMDDLPMIKRQLVYGETVIPVSDVEQMSEEAKREQEILRNLGARAAIMVPLRYGNHAFGLMGLSLGHPCAWKDSEVHGLSLVGQIIADSLQRIDATNRLVNLAKKETAAREEAEAASRAKNEFLSSMSHELRTPLNAILGFSHLLCRDGQLGAQQREFAEEISSAGRHLLSLVDEVLDLSRIESGRVDLSIEPVSCAAVVRESLGLIEPLAKKHEIRLQAAEPTALHVRADRTRLKQVLVNLLSNAVKYNRPGGSVSVRVTEAEEAVRLSVHDTGEGIPEQRRGELFTHFNRLGRESGTIEGTGIGLALSKRLVELMGGAIGVESVVGEGSTFWIELPVCEDAAEPRSVAAEEPCDDTGCSDDTESRVTVLYIEDNPAAIRLMERVLATDGGYRLVSAHTGTLGVEIAEVERPGVMLVDINLPGIDGYEVLRRVRESEWGAAVPVIALSANAMESAVRRGETAGFNAYITKPFDIDSFLATLEEIARGE